MTLDGLDPQGWKNKPTDRFILKWIKLYLSAPITIRLVHIRWVQPWIVTICSMIVGALSGLFFISGWGFLAGLMAGFSQVLDGMDGQLARLTGKQSDAGAFLDSVLDRYSDGAIVIGIIIFVMRQGWNSELVLALGTLALIGSSLISYSSARAESLGLRLGRPTLASKGTRTTVIAVSGLLGPLFSITPMMALCYVALHSNLVVLYRIAIAFTNKRLPVSL